MSPVCAAPNKSILSGQVINLERNTDGKVMVEFKVDDIETLFGPCFAKSGQQLQCFTFLDTASFSPGVPTRIAVEYIGGPHKGIYQILEIISPA